MKAEKVEIKIPNTTPELNAPKPVTNNKTTIILVALIGLIVLIIIIFIIYQSCCRKKKTSEKLDYDPVPKD